MKMYVWANPYHVSYGSSLVVAIADSLPEARKEACKGMAYSFGEFEQARPDVPLGKPTRIVNLPCAEWHEWSE